MMKLTQYICDRCSRKIEDEKRYKVYFKEMSSSEDLKVANGVPFPDLVDCDFCNDCMMKIVAFITNEEIETVTIKEDAPTPPHSEDKPKKKTYNKSIDKGKILALDKANWSVKEIAHECNCSQQTVYRIISDSLSEKVVNKS